MKKLVKVLLLSLIISGLSYSNNVLRLDIGEWAPYTSEKDPKGKIAEVIVAEAFKEVGFEVKYEYFPWKRSYEQVKKGESVGTFPWVQSEEREKDFFISKEAIVVDKVVFFHLKNLDFSWNSYEDLKKYKIGGTIGFIDAEEMKKAGIEIDTVSKESQNFKKILAGRIDVYPASFLVGYNLINKLFSPDKAALFTNNTKPTREGRYHVLISKQIPNGKEIVSKFDTGLKKLKESGRYNDIIAEFLGTK